MAHQDDASTYADLLARLGDEGSKELFRHLLEEALQDLIDSELSAQIGAGRHERSQARSNYRNGGRTRTPSTPAGDVELRIPRLFFLNAQITRPPVPFEVLVGTSARSPGSHPEKARSRLDRIRRVHAAQNTNPR